jgi:phage anti-repressor protein
MSHVATLPLDNIHYGDKMKAENKVVPLFQAEALIEIKHEQIGEDVVECVSARELYINLGHDIRKWVRWHTKNIIKNEWFIENRDWSRVPILVHVRAKTDDFLVTIEFAKHISMMAKTQKAHDYRNYLINCEKRLIHSQHAQLEAAQQRLKNSIPLNPDCPKAITGAQNNSDINLLHQRMEADGLIIKHEIVKVLFRWMVTTKGAEMFGARNSLSGIRISKEYHEALRDLMKQALHEDQDDIFEDYPNEKGE